MNSISDAVLNIKGHFYERVKSPFSLTLVLVAIYAYWPIIFISLDSKLKSSEKISAIRLMISDEGFSSLIDVLSLSVVLMLVFSVFSILGSLIGEAQSRISKEIRNRVNVDYISSKEYSATIGKLESQLQTLAETIKNKDQGIQLLIIVSQFTDAEKNLFGQAIENAGVLSKDGLDVDQIALCDAIHKKGVWGISNNSYRITQDNVLKYAPLILEPRNA